MGIRVSAPLVFNLGAGWSSVTNITPWLLNPQESAPVLTDWEAGWAEARVFHSVAWSLYRLCYSGSPCPLLRGRKSEPIAKKGYVMKSGERFPPDSSAVQLETVRSYETFLPIDQYGH